MRQLSNASLAEDGNADAGKAMAKKNWLKAEEIIWPKMALIVYGVYHPYCVVMLGAQRWLTELRCELQVVALSGFWVQSRRCRNARIGPLISRSRACYQFLDREVDTCYAGE